MDTMPSMKTQALIDNEGLKEVKIEIDIKNKKFEMIDVVSKGRDIVEDVKDFLEKDKLIFDDPTLFQGLINLDTLSLSPIQKFKLTSFAQAKAREETLKSHNEDSELLNLSSSVLSTLR